jgi:hypothetical protein
MEYGVEDTTKIEIEKSLERRKTKSRGQEKKEITNKKWQEE